MPTAPPRRRPTSRSNRSSRSRRPREFRLHPRDRTVAYTAEAAGARQVFTLSLRGGYPAQLTASDKPASDPQWSPDGRRIAFVRDEEIWVVEADGSRLTKVVGKPGGGRAPRWSPDGHRLAFLSRRRGWTQIWLIDAPVPRRGRPATEPKPPRADRPDRERRRRRRVRVVARRPPDRGDGPARPGRRGDRRRSPSSTSRRARRGSWPASGASTSAVAGLRDGSLLYVSDADGWFQVVRLTADGHDRIVLTSGEREHGDPSGGARLGAAAVARRQPLRPCRGPRRPQDLVVGDLAAAEAPQARPRPAAEDAPDRDRRDRGQPDQPVGRRLEVGRLARRRGVGRGRPASARPGPPTCGCCRCPASPPDDARPRQVTDSLPAVLRDALSPVARARRRARRHSRRATGSGSRARSGARTPRPASAAGRACRRSSTRTAARPASRSARFQPFKQLLVAEGFAFFDVDFRGSTGYGRAFRVANHDEWGHADVHDLVDAARWAADAALVGWPAGDLRRLVRRLHGPVRARRRAGDVAGRRRPVRRLGDRRELPPRRSSRPPATSTR